MKYIGTENAQYNTQYLKSSSMSFQQKEGILTVTPMERSDFGVHYILAACSVKVPTSAFIGISSTVTNLTHSELLHTNFVNEGILDREYYLNPEFNVNRQLYTNSSSLVDLDLARLYLGRYYIEAIGEIDIKSSLKVILDGSISVKGKGKGSPAYTPIRI